MDSTIEMIDAETQRLTSASAPSAPGAWSDWVGMVASIGCAIHCAAMPFVIAYLPAMGLSFLADEAFHKWMALACFFIALVAFIPGIRKHGSWTPLTIASIGLAMITGAAFGFAGECCPSCATEAPAAAHADEFVCTDAGCTLCPSEPAATIGSGSDLASVGLTASLQPAAPWVGRIVPFLTPIGGIVLVSAHLLNRRYGCLCGCCGSEASEGAVE